jgi:hypothetical protein
MHNTHSIFPPRSNNKNQYTSVKPGSPLFLYNYSDKTLDGPFRATSDCAKNIQKKAFGGKFPWQCSFAFWKPQGDEEIEPVTLDVDEVRQAKRRSFLPWQAKIFELAH